LVYDFDYDSRGLHKGGTLSVNGKKVGEGRIEKTMGAPFSLVAEEVDVGEDAILRATKNYDAWVNKFSGTINTLKCRASVGILVLT
jgi:arylsulfatase